MVDAREFAQRIALPLRFPTLREIERRVAKTLMTIAVRAVVISAWLTALLLGSFLRIIFTSIPLVGCSAYALGLGGSGAGCVLLLIARLSGPAFQFAIVFLGIFLIGKASEWFEKKLGRFALNGSVY